MAVNIKMVICLFHVLYSGVILESHLENGMLLGNISNRRDGYSSFLGRIESPITMIKLYL